MKRVREIITCLIIFICFTPLTVKAGVEKDNHIAVKAMQEVWDFENGCLEDEATEDMLEEAVSLIENVKTYAIWKDLHAMKYAAQAEFDRIEAERIAREADEARKANSHIYGTCRITFYCSCSQCCGQWGNTTASGATPTAGWTVANGSLPFGTKVLIDGHEYCVEDRGVGDDQFDIYVNSHSEALTRGLYYTEVQIIG